jgi:glycerophosphoryl diester phosphodiesterase
MVKYIICSITIILIYSCNKIHYYEDKTSVLEVETKFLSHHGGGDNFPSNTYLAAVYGLNQLDGIEVDIQLGKNGTIWLGHEPMLPLCGGYGDICIREASDDYINKIDTCLGPADDFCKLDRIFKLIADSFPDKYISLDAKAWKPCDFINNLDMIGEMNFLGDRIITLKNRYNLKHVMVESETTSFLKYIKKHSSGIECYLTTFGDFERGMMIALQKNLDGISFQYKFKEGITLDHVRMIRKKGLKIHLWTVNSTEYIQEATSIDPDFIQTDNINYATTLLK